MADMCSAVAAINLPPDQCVRTLKALILTGSNDQPYPMNQAAIKMLTKVSKTINKVMYKIKSFYLGI